MFGFLTSNSRSFLGNLAQYSTRNDAAQRAGARCGCSCTVVRYYPDEPEGRFRQRPASGYGLSPYTLFLNISLLLSLAVMVRRAGRRVARPDRYIDGAWVALVGGVVGARVGYVSAHWAYFATRTDQAYRFWLGGLSWHGALAGVVLVLALYCRIRKLSLRRLADELALVAPAIGAAAALGCIRVGCAYGREVLDPCWLATELPDLFGVVSYRYNVSLLTAVWNLLLLVGLWAGTRHAVPGVRTGLLFVGWGAGLGLIDLLRGDAVPYWGSVRVDVILNWLLAGIGVAMAWLARSGCRMRRLSPGARS